MTPLVVSSPHAHGPASTTRVMTQVMLATIPGALALVWFFGAGVILNVLLACTGAAAAEALMLALRGRPVVRSLTDGSAVLTGLLLALALPPVLPAWLPLLGASFAIVFGKHLYGGIGQNPFNPAMLGYVVLLVSFPLEMTTWAPAGGGASLTEALATSFGGGVVPDAFSGPTPLDDFKHRAGLTVQEWKASSSAAGTLAGAGWEWVNLAFAAGGLWMLRQRLFTWHAPVAMLAALSVLALLFWDGGSSASRGSPVLHLLSGATMFGAFFIVTDPVSCATSTRGKLVFGAGVGVLLYVIRAWGNYPDAIAFAVLLMNLAAPFIDHYTRPRVYGHGTKRRSTA